MATFCKPIKFRIFTFLDLNKIPHYNINMYYLALHDEPDGQGDIGTGIYWETVNGAGACHHGAV